MQIKTTFSISDSKLFVPVVFLSTQDNTKLLELLLEQRLTGINSNQKFQQKYKIDIYISLLNQVFKKLMTFCFII